MTRRPRREFAPAIGTAVARTDHRFREAFNAALELCSTLGEGGVLPSETTMADRAGVSRTVTRSVLQTLDKRGIVRWRGRNKTIIRLPQPDDRLETLEQALSIEELEARFLDWVLRFDIPPGTALNVAALSRNFSVGPHVLQEFLGGLARFSLVEHRSGGGWRLLGFTREFAVELSDFRAVLELDAVCRFATLSRDDTSWAQLDTIEARHHSLLAEIDTRFHDFSQLDENFHDCLGQVVQNRFVTEFRKVISLIFHYHYQWDKTNERARNEAAIKEHLAIISALKARNVPAAQRAAKAHLVTSKQTLLASLREHQLA